MRLSLTNCRNIARVSNDDTGEDCVEFREGVCNILYAPNGTGKTTLTYALDYKLATGEKDVHYQKLKSFQCLSSEGTGSPAGDSLLPHVNLEGDSYSDMLAFNQEWIEQHCFMADSLRDGVYRLFLNGQKLSGIRRQRDRLIADLRALSQDDSIADLRRRGTEFNKACGRPGKRGYTQSSNVGRAFRNGGPLQGMPRSLESVKAAADAEGCLQGWIKWHYEGVGYIPSNGPFRSDGACNKRGTKNRLIRGSVKFCHDEIVIGGNLVKESEWRIFEEALEKLAAASGVRPSDMQWVFYYDETGNYRRVSYKDGVVPDERSVNRNFILGGLAFASVEAERQAVKIATSLPAPQGEIKSKAVLGGSDDLFRTLSRKEVSVFLEVLKIDDILVHYSAQDNLYFATADIVDSLLALDLYRHLVPYHRELKNALFTCTGADPKVFLDFVRRYGYPNVEGEDIEPFCNFLADVLRACLDRVTWYRDSPSGYVAELLCGMLRAASKEDELVFLSGNPENDLVSGFLYHYTQGCLMFPKSRHVFDMEPSISAVMGERANNYEFVDSKASVPVQLSDVLVGLLARPFSFFDRLHPKDLERQRNRMSATARENLDIVRKAIIRSNEASPALIRNVNADTELVLRDYCIGFLCD